MSPSIMISFLLNPSPKNAAGRPRIPAELNESFATEASQKHETQKAPPSIRASPDEQASTDSTGQQNEEPTKEQPNTSDLGETIIYKHQQWVYKGHQWDEEGILSLKLQLAGSDGEPAFVREAEVQSDNPEALFGLWKATDRPVNPVDAKFYEPFAIHAHRRSGKQTLVLVQWTGFNKASENTTWMLEKDIDEAARGILKEYWAEQSQRASKVPHRVVKARKGSKPRRSRHPEHPQRPQRPQRGAKQRL